MEKKADKWQEKQDAQGQGEQEARLEVCELNWDGAEREWLQQRALISEKQKRGETRGSFLWEHEMLGSEVATSPRFWGWAPPVLPQQASHSRSLPSLESLAGLTFPVCLL